jgi:galactokinase
LPDKWGRGRMLLLDCWDKSIAQVAFDHLDLALVLMNSHRRHELSEGEYAMRRRGCESVSTVLGLKSLRDLTWSALDESRGQLDKQSFLRAEHVVRENERTIKFVRHMRNGDWLPAGEMLYQSHASLREKFQRSCIELDQLVGATRKIGVEGGFGARLTGAGFGGSMIALVERGKASDVVARIVEDYNKVGAALSRPMASGFVAEGARVLQVATG